MLTRARPRSAAVERVQSCFVASVPVHVVVISMMSEMGFFSLTTSSRCRRSEDDRYGDAVGGGFVGFGCCCAFGDSTPWSALAASMVPGCCLLTKSGHRLTRCAGSTVVVGGLGCDLMDPMAAIKPRRTTSRADHSHDLCRANQDLLGASFAAVGRTASRRGLWPVPGYGGTSIRTATPRRNGPHSGSGFHPSADSILPAAAANLAAV